MVSTMSFGQLAETTKTQTTNIVKSSYWWDLYMTVTEGDTAYCLTYVDQRYPALKPKDILCFTSKQDVVDLFNGVLKCAEDKTLVLTGSNFKLTKSFGGVSITNMNGSYTIITLANAKKALAFFEK